MALTENNPTNTGATTYPFTFPYLKPTDVKVSVSGVVKTYLTHWEFDTPTTIKFKTGHVPAAGQGTIRIYRETDDSKLEAQFFAGSAIKSSDLNDNFTQNLYVTQESNNKIDAAWTSGDETIISSETWVSADNRVSTTAAQDARIDSKIDTALTTDVAAGNKITVTDNSPGSGQITVGVTPASLVDSDINASAAIAGTKIDPQFGTQNVSLTGNITVSGTVDGRDVSVDGAKLDTCDTGAKDDQTAAEIRVLVESATDSNVFTDNDHTRLNAIEDNATRDQTDAEIRAAVDNATDSNVFTDADHTKLDGIDTGATDDQTAAEIKTLIATSPLDASHLAVDSVGDSEIVTGALDNRYYTETELLTGGVLDGRYFTETESDARYFNISSGDTIKDGDTFPDNDTTIATTAAINDRIIDLVDDVGGFVPIANETSFPNANPDVNNGAGTLISIKALSSNITSNGSGVATITNGTVGNSTVTITGLENSTTYSTSYGMIVETTSTLNTYTFHRQVPIATEVTTVASNIANVNAVGNNISNVNTVAGNTTNINTVSGANTNINTVSGSIANVNTVATNITNVNDFSDKYRVASSAPTSNNDTGDLYFDTSSSELRVYNGSAWQGGVTATGNLASLGANTFTGAQTFISGQTFDGRDVSVDGAKLDGIEAGATGDQTNSEIRTAVEAANDSNVFTDADHTKLNAIEAGATGDQTNAEIRAAVEAATDSNVFTDADHTKLNAIESGATADQTASEILNAVKSVDGAGSGLDADLLDSYQASEFVTSQASDTLTGAQYTFSSTTNEKIILSGSSAPKIVLQEGTTNKAQFQWSSNGNIYIWNDEHNRGLQLGSYPAWYDGNGYQTIWHAGNDGSGSGLDADTLDGVHGSSFLRSDAADSTNSNLTIKGFTHSNTNNQNYELSTASSSDGSGLVLKRGDGTFQWQIYGSSGQYGFLDGTWASWDLKKTIGGQLQVDVGGTLYEVYHKGNNSNILQKDSQGYYRGTTWIEFYNTVAGLYWNGGAGSGWEVNPNTNWYMTFKSGNSSSSAIDFRTSNNVQRGYVYADSSYNIGFLDSGGSWSLSTNRGTSTTTLWDQNFKSDTDNTYDLGGSSSSYRWRNGYFGGQVHANTYYGDGSNLTNLPAGGAAFTATASGALAAGKAVMVNANGTVSEIKTNTVGADLNQYPLQTTSQYVTSGQMQMAQTAVDPVHRKLISCNIHAVASSKYGIIVKGLNAGGGPTGTMQSYNMNRSAPDSPWARPEVVYSPDNQMTAVFTGGYDIGTMRLVKPNSTDPATCTFSVSNEHTFSNTNNSARHLAACYDTSANKFIIAYTDNNNSHRAYIRTCTVTGTTTSASVSYGSATQFESANVRYPHLCYDSVNNRSYLVYRMSNNNQVYLRYITVSGTSISLGSAVHVASNGNEYQRIAYNKTDNNVVLMWHDNGYKAKAGTPGSSSITWGTGVVYITSDSNCTNHGDLIYAPVSNHYYAAYRYASNAAYCKRISVTGSNSSATVNGGSVWNNSWYYQYDTQLCVTPENNGYWTDEFVIVSHLGSSSQNGYMTRITATSTTSNLLGPMFFVGFPKQAYSSGQTATIQTYGSVIEGLSGLSVGSTHFVQPDGSVSTTAPDSNQMWQRGEGFTYDSSSSSAIYNSWNPDATSASDTGNDFRNSPLAGIGLSSTKLLLTPAVHQGNPNKYLSWAWNHQH